MKGLEAKTNFKYTRRDLFCIAQLEDLTEIKERLSRVQNKQSKQNVEESKWGQISLKIHLWH